MAKPRKPNPDIPLDKLWRQWLLEPAAPEFGLPQRDAKPSNLRELFEATLKQARDGDLKAIALILDRAYGRAGIDAAPAGDNRTLGEIIESLGAA